MDTTHINASIGKDHYRVVMQAGKNTIIGDKPADKGGADEGMDPHQLLASALGCCTCITVRMYADRKEWPLEGMHVTISLVHDILNNTIIQRDIELTGPLSAEQKDRLIVIANKCPVHKTLTNPIMIDTKLIR